MADVSKQLVLDSIKESLKNGEYSDLVITCGTDTYNVHTMIICARAGFFARAVKFGGKESDEGKIDLPDDEPASVALLMQYLYEGEYEPLLPTEENTKISTPVSAGNRKKNGKKMEPAKTDRATGYAYSYGFPHSCSTRNYYELCSENYAVATVCPHHLCGTQCAYNCVAFICEKCTHIAIDGQPDQLLLHSKMYEIADKYDVHGLKDLAKVKFERSCAAFWNDEVFPTAAHHAFSTTIEDDKGLRDIVSGTISNHMELIRKAEIQALMTEFNGLAMGILLKKADEHGWGVK